VQDDMNNIGGLEMKKTDWMSQTEKPDYNGVYERKNLSKPGSLETYCLYRNGWHVDCETIEAAAQSREKPGLNYSRTEGGLRVIEIGKGPNMQWRGLANRPKGIKIEISDKYKYI